MSDLSKSPAFEYQETYIIRCQKVGREEIVVEVADDRPEYQTTVLVHGSNYAPFIREFGINSDEKLASLIEKKVDAIFADKKLRVVIPFEKSDVWACGLGRTKIDRKTSRFSEVIKELRRRYPPQPF